MFVTSEGRNILAIGGSSMQLYLIALLGVIGSLLSPGYIWLYIISIFVIYFSILFKEKFVLFSVTVLLLAFVGEINPTIRIVIQLSSLFILAFIILRKKGLNVNKYPKLPSSISAFVIILYIALTTSILNSDYSFAAIPLVLRLTSFFVFVYLFYTIIKSIDEVRIIISAIIFSAIIVAIGVIYNFLNSGFDILLIVGGGYRTGGFISNFNAAAGYFAIAIPLLLASLYKMRTTKETLLKIIIVGLLFVALLITGSRSALLACVVSISLIIYFLNRKLFLKITIFSVILVLILFIIEPTRDFLTLLLRLESGLTHRDHLWKISYSLIEENLIFGIGPGAYAYKMFDHLPVMLDSFEGQVLISLYQMTFGTNSSHNFYLIMFTDLGILGLIASLMLPYVVFKISKTVLQNMTKSSNSHYYIVIGVVSTLAGLLVRALFDGINILSYGWISVDLPFWLMFCILFYFYRNISHEKKQFSEVYS